MSLKVECESCGSEQAVLWPRSGVVSCGQCGAHYIPASPPTRVVISEGGGFPPSPAAGPTNPSPPPPKPLGDPPLPKNICPYCRARPHKETCGLWSPYQGEHE
jgi:hypothetical protein